MLHMGNYMSALHICEKVGGVSVACDCHQSRPSHMSHHNGDTQAWISLRWHAHADNYHFTNSYIHVMEIDFRLYSIFIQGMFITLGLDTLHAKTLLAVRNYASIWLNTIPFQWDLGPKHQTLECAWHGNQVECLLCEEMILWPLDRFIPRGFGMCWTAGDRFRGTRRSSDPASHICHPLAPAPSPSPAPPPAAEI